MLRALKRAWGVSFTDLLILFDDLTAFGKCTIGATVILVGCAIFPMVLLCCLMIKEDSP